MRSEPTIRAALARALMAVDEMVAADASLAQYAEEAKRGLIAAADLAEATQVEDDHGVE